MESHQLYSIIVTVTLHELTSTYESAEVVSVRERRGHIHVRETDGVEVYISHLQQLRVYQIECICISILPPLLRK